MLVLASASPRRAALLRTAGFEFVVCPVNVDESARPGESAAAYVRRLAMEKSACAQDLVRQQAAVSGSGLAGPTTESPVIVGADTAVVLGGAILGKPRDNADAKAMLRQLSGRRHEVMTGVSVRRGEIERGRVEVTGVYFATLSDTDVSSYVASGEGADKAGGYAIQGLAARFISGIEGSYSNVVGLPVACVVELLKELGCIPLPVGLSCRDGCSQKSL